MKVIKEGNYNGQFPMRVKCQRVVDIYGFAYGDDKDFCGSVVEIEATDIKKHKWTKYPDYSGTDYGLVCPVCGRFIVVDTKKISEQVLDSAEEIFLN